MSENMYDDDAVNPDDGQLSVISDLALRQRELERKCEKLEDDLKTSQKLLRQVQEIDLPDAMMAAGCRSFTTSDGYGITIKEDISASLSEAKRGAAVAWLRANGYGDIVSDDIMLSFGKGQEDQAKAVVVEFAERGLFPVRKTNVNTATLKALIREMMADGKEVPLDTLGAYQWKKAIIK